MLASACGFALSRGAVVLSDGHVCSENFSEVENMGDGVAEAFDEIEEAAGPFMALAGGATKPRNPSLF